MVDTKLSITVIQTGLQSQTITTASRKPRRMSSLRFVIGLMKIFSQRKFKRILVVYDQLEDDLASLAEQHSIGSINRASPPETVFIALVRDLQARAGVRVNLNQVKWGVIRDGAYEVDGPTGIEPATDPPAERETIAKQLEATGQLVFYGPPSTGKTYTAQQFARWWINERTTGSTKAEQLELTTFHPSFSYEDFIEGLTAKEKDGAVEYIVEPGVFKQICKRATSAYENSDSPETAPPYILIIDEINRGNLAQIFGELMTLLEVDKRLDAPNETRSSLAHSNESFVVPPNLYLIVTMNTADESIALLDAALRRRFRFYGFPPDFEKISLAYGIENAEEVVQEGGTRREQLIAASILALTELNTRIRGVNQLEKQNNSDIHTSIGMPVGRMCGIRGDSISCLNLKTTTSGSSIGLNKSCSILHRLI